MPTKPIKASAGQASRGGKNAPPRHETITSSRTVPSAKRVKMSAMGVISRKAAFVATKEIPQRMTAPRAASRGGSGLEGIAWFAGLVFLGINPVTYRSADFQ